MVVEEDGCGKNFLQNYTPFLVKQYCVVSLYEVACLLPLGGGGGGKETIKNVFSLRFLVSSCRSGF